MQSSLSIVFIGLSITSAWANCHAAIYRSLIKGLQRNGHRVLFLEWDAPWYRQHRDLPSPSFCEVGIYDSLETLQSRFEGEIRAADAVVVGSYTYEGVEIGRWIQEQATGVTAFYDIDTPLTLVRLHNNGCGYLSMDLIPRYDVYLSATGGPLLQRIEAYGARRVFPLYCSVDTDLYFPEMYSRDYDLAYLGNYSPDRQPTLERFLVDTARHFPRRRFAVAGANYPAGIHWPGNVDYVEYLPPKEHREFYNRQRFTLNVTRPDVVAWGYSPCIRLLEAAACGVPVISDYWVGLETFFEPGKEIVTAQSTREVTGILESYSPEECAAMGMRARSRVLMHHAGIQRARELVVYLMHHSPRLDRKANCYDFPEGRIALQEQLLGPM